MTDYPRQLDDRGLDNNECFGCSRTNPEGLGMRFAQTGPDAVEAAVTLRPELCGWPGVAHGGMVTLLIDEVTSWCYSACLDETRFATRELTVRFLRPTPVGKRLIASARLVADRGRTADLVGEVRTADGALTARGRVQIVRFDAEEYGRFQRRVAALSAER